MCTQNSPAAITADRNQKTCEPRDLEEANFIGDLNRLQVVYCAWFAKQRPEPTTGVICKNDFYFTAVRAATNDQPAILALLSQGINLNRNLPKAAMMSGPTRVLQVLIDHRWNINEAEAYCEPPFLAYAFLFGHDALPNSPVSADSCPNLSGLQ